MVRTFNAMLSSRISLSKFLHTRLNRSKCDEKRVSFMITMEKETREVKMSITLYPMSKENADWTRLDASKMKI